MKNIVINILTKSNIDENHAKEFLKNCTSKKFNVEIHIFDYTLDKKIKNYNLQSVDPNIHVHEFDYEDMSDFNNRVIEFIQKDCFAFMNLSFSISLEKDFIDDLDLECFEDENYGCVYPDFYVQSESGPKIIMYQKSIPLVNNSVPLIAFSTRRYIENLGEENIAGLLMNTKISKHIPKALCTIEPNV